MLNTVIQIVEDVAAGIPVREAPPAATLAELTEEFHALDKPLAEALHERLGRVAPQGWVVDAMDGAVQYLQGLPQWCVSVALVRDGQPVLTVLHSPVLGETYAAERGKGAWRDGEPIRPSAKTDLAAALGGTSHPPANDPQQAAHDAAGRALPGMLKRIAAVRNLGPTSWQVADVAAGRMDVFWEFGRDPENLVGPSLIAVEAGARLTTAGGGAWTPDADSFLVAAPGLHAAALAAISSGVGDDHQ
ncbi:inositol monophosphatase family protein [Actinokineospora inagensis]|uniref:inositol monophosphatase family protein n=1 Tax=Actinokineospora inagensis TaxID=103730 RepID=UPI0005529BDC|nr:inositol monophosphatase [Actinokineospora inagensis]